LNRVRFFSLVLIVSLVMNMYLLPSYYLMSSEMEGLREQLREANKLLRQLRSELQELKPYVVAVGGITVGFAPNATARYVPNNCMTFLSGFVFVGNLSNVKVRPVDLTVSFKVNATADNPEGVRFKYKKDMVLQDIVEDVDYVEIPFTIYPITVLNQSVGSEVVFLIYINVTVYYKNEPVASGFCVGVRSLVITGGEQK